MNHLTSDYAESESSMLWDNLVTEDKNDTIIFKVLSKEYDYILFYADPKDLFKGEM